MMSLGPSARNNDDIVDGRKILTIFVDIYMCRSSDMCIHKQIQHMHLFFLQICSLMLRLVSTHHLVQETRPY